MTPTQAESIPSVVVLRSFVAMRVILALLAVLPFWAVAQGVEVAEPTGGAALAGSGGRLSSHKTADEPDTVGLPFFENFFQTSEFPDTARWWGDSVSAHVSHTVSYGVPDYGALLLDGTEKDGEVFNLSGITAYADFALTNYFDLSGLSPDDSLYLSFYYQAGGRGNAPEESDSLVVEFRTEPDSNGVFTWVNAWSANGAVADSNWRYALIPVTDSSFFHDGFQVRFRTYGNLGGRFDLWFVDYLALAAGRNFQDTSAADVGIAQVEGALFDSLWATTARAFQASPVTQLGELTVTVRNNGNTPATRNLTLTLTDSITGALYATQTTPVTVPPFGTDTVRFTPSTAGPVGEAVLELTATLDGTDDRPQNNVLRLYFPLHSFAQASDEEPESGYGLLSPNGFGTIFKVPTPDTIDAVWYKWFPDAASLSGVARSFRVAIWADTTAPESPTYLGFASKFLLNAQNTWIRYPLTEPLPVEGTVVVGVLQTSNTPLAVGLDKSPPFLARGVFERFGVFEPLDIPGNLCIRAEFASAKQLGPTDRPVQLSAVEVQLFPNPARKEAQLVWAPVLWRQGRVQVLDLTGRVLKNQPVNAASGEVVLTLEQLSAGAYPVLLTLQAPNGTWHQVAKRLVVVR